MVSVSCPTCGSQVSFRTEFSTHAVCNACDSLLVRQGAQVDQIGKVAELAPDGSPLRLGTQGRYEGKSFEIVGRIQISFGDGYWNEWFLLYSNGETGWLGEAMGEYFINSQAKVGGSLPQRQDLAPGDGLSLGGEAFVVTGRVESRLVSYEGEIPFVVDPQNSFLTIDLRSASGKAATIDYSESPPLLFLGEYRPFLDFSFQGLRLPGEGDDERARTSVAEAGVSNFNCPSCGAPHTVNGGVRSKVLVCQYCGSAVDVSNPKLEIMWREDSMRRELQKGVTIPLYSVARLDGHEFVLIGFLKKSVTYEGIRYPWVEYLLYNQVFGYRWLVESDGHFTFMEPMPGLPRRGEGPVTRPDEQAVTFKGRTYRHFQTSNPRIDAVAGEFYWKVKTQDKATNFDYISPPYLLSLEATGTEFVWSQGRYLESDEVAAIFGLSKQLPPKVGIAPSQPNPHDEVSRSHWKVFWVALVAGFLLMISPVLSSKTVWRSDLDAYQTNRTFTPKESRPFEISGQGNLAFEFSSSLNNRWLFFDTTLVDAKTGQDVKKVGMTVDNYSGAQARTRKVVRVTGVPAGEYKLRWMLTSGSSSATADPVGDANAGTERLDYSITLTRGVPVWGWYLLMLMILLPIPLYESARRSSFETKRWYNSDHS